MTPTSETSVSSTLKDRKESFSHISYAISQQQSRQGWLCICPKTYTAEKAWPLFIFIKEK